MPFIEVSGPTHDIAINDKSLYIRKHIKDKYFQEKHFVQIFIDIENKLLGILPSDKGYPIPKDNTSVCIKPLKHYLLGRRKLCVKWSDKHQMLIAKL